MKQKTSLLVALISVLFMYGCSSEDDLNLDLLPIDESNETAALAIANLDSQISGARQTFENNPTSLIWARELTSLVLSRAHFTNRFEGFDEAVSVIERLSDVQGGNPEFFDLKATVDTTRHLFDLAESHWKSKNEPTAQVRAISTRIAQGTITEDDLSILRARAESFPSVATYIDLATGLTAVALYDEADAAYESAIQVNRDVSPFIPATIAFQRGVLWGERADMPTRAYNFYKQALRALPQYVVARVHMTELEWEYFGLEKAIELIRPTAESTRDAEAMGLLGELLTEKGDIDEAQLWISRAKEKYEDLLTNHPAAFWDHGSEFFAGPGNDPSRALELAQLNLNQRKTSRAFEIAISAAQSKNDTTAICDLVARAQDLDVIQETLGNLLAELEPSC